MHQHGSILVRDIKCTNKYLVCFFWGNTFPPAINSWKAFTAFVVASALAVLMHSKISARCSFWDSLQRNLIYLIPNADTQSPNVRLLSTWNIIKGMCKKIHPVSQNLYFTFIPLISSCIFAYVIHFDMILASMCHVLGKLDGYIFWSGAAKIRGKNKPTLEIQLSVYTL